MKPKFKFSAAQIDAVQGAIAAFQNQGIKDIAVDYVVTGGRNGSPYEQDHYSQAYSRNVQAPVIVG